MALCKNHPMKTGCISHVLSKLFHKRDWTELDEYSTNCTHYFHLEFSKHSVRFPEYHKLVAKFEDCINRVKVGGKSLFHLAHEAHNELCVALALLENTNPTFDLLEYEPALMGTTKSIDFKAISSISDVYYVDVKTIRPTLKDRWSQYEQLTKYVSKNINLLLDKDWLGGEIWHGMYSSRGKMLDYSRELEEKVFYASLSQENNRIIMVFCGDNYHWHEDDLEDFVEFYFSGSHRDDDLFAGMELYQIQANKYSIDRTITNFCFLKRRQMEIVIEGINWDVGGNSHAKKITY